MSRVRARDHNPSAPTNAMPRSSLTSHAFGAIARSTPLRMHREIVDADAESSGRCPDAPSTASSKRRLQIAAMRGPIGRAVAERDVIAERNARELAARRGLTDGDGLRHDDMRFEPLARRRARSDARVAFGRELDAGAGLGQPLGLFGRGRRGSPCRASALAAAEAADPGAGDEDGSRCRHGVPA